MIGISSSAIDMISNVLQIDKDEIILGNMSGFGWVFRINNHEFRLPIIALMGPEYLNIELHKLGIDPVRIRNEIIIRNAVCGD